MDPIEVSVTEAFVLLRDGEKVFCLDVRENDERAACLIAGSHHIPLREIPQRIEEIPTEKTLIIYCHSGVRSRYVAEFLRQNGYDGARNLSGGIEAWAQEIDPSLNV